MTDDPITLPPLPIVVLRRIQRIQKSALRSLRDCRYAGTNILDERRALEFLRTYLIEELKIRLDFYETVPEFHWNWMASIGSDAAHSVLACFPSNLLDREAGPSSYASSVQFLPGLVQTGWDYVTSRRIAQGKNAEPVPAIDSKVSREGLRDAYRKAFPNPAIIDICWAACQHRREWDRWLKYEVPDGSKPDRAFRSVLLGGKAATEIRKEIRPKGWK